MDDVKGLIEKCEWFLTFPQHQVLLMTNDQ